MAWRGGFLRQRPPGLKPVSLENPRQDTSVAAEVVSHTAHMGGAFSGLLLGILITRSSVFIDRFVFRGFFFGAKAWGRGRFFSSSSSVAWVFPFRPSLRKTRRKTELNFGGPLCYDTHKHMHSTWFPLKTKKRVPLEVDLRQVIVGPRQATRRNSNYPEEAAISKASSSCCNLSL